jgi:hypothetical protein
VTRCCRVAAICSGDKARAGGGVDAPGDSGANGAVVETGPASEVPANVTGAVRSGADVIGAEVTLGSVGDGGGSDMIGTRSLDTKLVEPRVLPGLGRRL